MKIVRLWSAVPWHRFHGRSLLRQPLFNVAKRSGSSARDKPTAKSGTDMKNRPSDTSTDELRPHYDFDFKKMKPQRFASQELTYKERFVVLDEDVSKVFDSSEAVNEALRSMIRGARPKRSRKKRARG